MGHTRVLMDGPEGAYAYAPGVGRSMASDHNCYGQREKDSHELRRKDFLNLSAFATRNLEIWIIFYHFVPELQLNYI